jgi:DNA-binding transcriptional LysR family regulator
MLPDLDLNLLKPLAALLEARSVTVAARRLGLTQAATSNALARCRKVLNDPLLVRVGNQLELTTVAKELSTRVASAVAMTSAVFARRQFEPASLNQPVVVATSDHIDMVLLGAFEAQLRQVAPRCSLLVEAFGPQTFVRLDSREVTLAIAPLYRVPPAFRTVGLFEDRLVLAAQPQLLRKPPRTAAAVAALDFLVVAPVGGTRGAIDVVLDKQGLKRRVVRSVPQFGMAAHWLAQREWVALLPESFVRMPVCRKLAWVPLPADVSLPALKMRAAWSRLVDNDPHHRFFRSVLAPAVVESRLQT